MKRVVLSQWISVALVAIVLPHCAPSSKAGLPPGSPFADHAVQPNGAIIHGVAVGDVTSQSASIWFRTVGPSMAQVEWVAEGGETGRSSPVRTVKEHDFTAAVFIEGLAPKTSYRYRIVTGTEEDFHNTRSVESASGRFVTGPPDEQSERQTFVWSGDLGGQQQCRRPASGYAIFDQMFRRNPSFAVLLGDLIYGDDRCPAPPNISGSDFVASSLDEFRAKHRYQREDLALQRFLAAVPVYAMWDDHEVRNNFSGLREPLMAVGRQALLEYWPIRTPAQEPVRLYRKFRRGADLEVFMLDTRQYRSSNGEKDGPQKTMLGAAQRNWLLEGLTQSTATWKVIVTSIPLSNQKGGTLLVPGNDSWARGSDGTGFQTELGLIVRSMLDAHIRNVVWIAGDVHYAQVNAYDPNGDGIVDFHEFICGPLSAAHGRPVAPNPDLRPTTLFSEGGFSNFGVVTVDAAGLTLAIVDDGGTTRFERTFSAHRSANHEPLAMSYPSQVR